MSNGVTDRRQAHRPQPERRQQYRSWFDNNPLPMWAFDRETFQILAVNQVAIRHYGYSREEFLSMTLKDIRPPEDIPYLLEIARGDPKLAQGRHRKKDGTVIDVEVYGQRESWRGRPVEVVQIHDVTERKRGESKFRELLEAAPDAMTQIGAKTRNSDADGASNAIEERLRLIIDTIPTIIWRKLPDGSADFLNQRFREYTGLSLEDGLGWGWLNAFHPDDRAMEQWRAGLATGKPFEKEVRLRRADGEYRWFLFRAVPLRDEHGNIVKWYGLTCDIEEQKRAERLRALRESEERFRLLVEEVKDYAIFMLDPGGRVSSWNSGAERIKGYRTEEILGQHFSRFYTKEDVERGKPEKELRLAATEGRFEDDGWRVRKDGSRFWANAVITAIHDKSGLLTGFAKITRDFTERKRAEEALLLELSGVLLANLDISKLLSAISAGIRKVVPHDFATLAFHDSETDQLRLQLLDVAYEKDVPAKEITVPVEGSAPGWVFRRREPLILSPLETDRFKPETLRHLIAAGLKSACWLPLVSRDRALGILAVASRREAAFTQSDVAMLSPITGQVALAVDNALAFRRLDELRDRLRQEKSYLEEELHSEYNFEEIVGESPVLKRVLKQVETVAPTDATVLILGETGTGKELIARAVHNLSSRREGTFAKLNCAAIPSGLLESELFGHEKGAFTGAISEKIGRLELAHQGTLFLDEVGDIPLEIQPKLLRALQEQEFERLGSTRTISVDFRLIAATNRDLAKMVKDRQFRSDLYYRLRVFPMTVPPLRERPGDIPALVRYFVQKHAKRMNKRIETIPAETMDALSRWHWPGNVRELENFIERAVILSQGPVLRVPLAELKPTHEGESGGEATLEAAEREHIIRVLRETGGVIGGPHGAAARLGIPRTTLNAKMRKLGIFHKNP